MYLYSVSGMFTKIHVVIDSSPSIPGTYDTEDLYADISASVSASAVRDSVREALQARYGSEFKESQEGGVLEVEVSLFTVSSEASLDSLTIHDAATLSADVPESASAPSTKALVIKTLKEKHGGDFKELEGSPPFGLTSPPQ